MGLWGRIWCLFAPHQVNRRRVKETEAGHRGYCQSCGAPIRRIDRDRWVRDWHATFGMATRPDPEKPAPKKRRRR